MEGEKEQMSYRSSSMFFKRLEKYSIKRAWRHGLRSKMRKFRSTNNDNKSGSSSSSSSISSVIQIWFVDEFCFKIVSVLEGIVLVSTLCFYFICCGCHI